jgi:predicted negative regulator of RcsB-dependent stress response
VGFDALFDALRGDIYLIQKKTEEAQSAYRAALDKADAKDGEMRNQLRLKLDALGDG